MSQLSTQPYKGARDFFPKDKEIQNWIFNGLRHVVSGFSYQEYDGPMLEPFELYAAKTGEEIVNQQLYSFTDRGDRKVAIRPEMTPTLARMVASQIQEIPKPIRWFSIPNLWRYERPQKGRLREHWQLNVDVLGGDTTLADVEIIELAVDIFKHFKAQDKVVIKVNNRRLMDGFFQKDLSLDAEKSLGLAKAIDAKDKLPPEKYDAWLNELGLNQDQKKKLDKFLGSSFDEIKKMISGPGVDELSLLFQTLSERGLTEQVMFDSKIMRGMDYYTGMVFEAYDVSPENRRALFGGGRYDNLVGMFSKQSLSGVGFGLGDVTFRDFLETHKLLPTPSVSSDVVICVNDKKASKLAAELAKRLRENNLRVASSLSNEDLGPQLKYAAKLGAKWVLILGADEIKNSQLSVKNLSTGKQNAIPSSDLQALLDLLKS